MSVLPVEWLPAWRIIPSRFPPVGLFDRVADPKDLEAVFALESMTNDRLRDEVGNLQLVPPEERICGAGTSIIMAAFTHLNPHGSRFSDGSFGVCYVSRTLETCIAETRYHREKFLAATQEGPMEIDMRAYNVDLKAELYHVGRQADILDASSYGASQTLARRLRAENGWGIVYHSVRHEGGMNAAAFRPRALSNCRQERHLCYVWNGERISQCYQKLSMA